MKYLLALFLCGCAVTPPNAEICVSLPSGSAFCTYTLEDKDRTIPKDEWQAMQSGRFSMSPDEFAKYQSFVDEVCIRYTCTEDQKKMFFKLRKMSEFYNGVY